jgi:hypothetical protein
MPKVQVAMTDSDGWKPLPKGTYTFIIDGAEQTLSSKNNAQLKVKAHVTQHPQYNDKISTIWLPMTARSVFRVEELLEATGAEFEKVDAAPGQKDADGYDIKFDLTFDTDDLVGMYFLADVDVEEYNGKDQNRFKNFRPLEGVKTAPANGGAAAETKAAGAAAGAAPGGAPAGSGGGDVQRRRRTVVGA